MSRFTIRIIDLKDVKERDPIPIKLLWMEIVERQAYGPTLSGLVRYARDGVQQKYAMSMDVGKGIFIATLEDHELGEISRPELEENLRGAAVEIMNIVRQDAIPRVFKRLLADYDYLVYDESSSEPSNLLRCRVPDASIPRHAAELFDIARTFNAMLLNRNYYVESYGEPYQDSGNFDEDWTAFALRAHPEPIDNRLEKTPQEMMKTASEKAAMEIKRRELNNPRILQTLLGDYGYLAYDAHRSKPPSLLKCRVTNPRHLRQAEDIFEIARLFSAATGETYRVESYSGTNNGGKLSEVWTEFALKKRNSVFSS